jgi:hypothetical protein
MVNRWSEDVIELVTWHDYTRAGGKIIWPNSLSKGGPDKPTATIKKAQPQLCLFSLNPYAALRRFFAGIPASQSVTAITPASFAAWP